jgi:hypothetical protein
MLADAVSVVDALWVAPLDIEPAQVSFCNAIDWQRKAACIQRIVKYCLLYAIETPSITTAV